MLGSPWSLMPTLVPRAAKLDTTLGAPCKDRTPRSASRCFRNLDPAALHPLASCEL